MACLGLDADVANNISFIRKKKWIPVSQRYNASLVYSYFKYKFKDLKITMGETQVENSCTILAVGNGQYYGCLLYTSRYQKARSLRKFFTRRQLRRKKLLFQARN